MPVAAELEPERLDLYRSYAEQVEECADAHGQGLDALDPRDRIIVELVRHVRHLEVRVAARHALGRRPKARAA